MIKTTFVMLKPDAVARCLVGKILSRFEEKGFIIKCMTMARLTREEAEALYQEHKNKEFFNRLIDFTISGPVVLTAMKGQNVFVHSRQVVNAVRDVWAISTYTNNLVHTSDSWTAASRELACVRHYLDWVNDTRADGSWVYNCADYYAAK